MNQGCFKTRNSVGGGGNVICGHSFFDEIISLDNLFLAWQEFSQGKRNKIDVQQFQLNIENNIFQLHYELKAKTYRHSNYLAFNVCDPKLRRIHKAIVKDRVLHHAIFRLLYPIFDRNFIFDSYSCRINKGTHKAVKRLEQFSRKQSGNYQNNIFALKCDIRKFFDSIDQEILLQLIKNKIQDDEAIWLINIIIKSFFRGLPLGNVTSQLFANIYLNEFDQFVKHNFKIKYYLRYCDDFIILSKEENYLKKLLIPINRFLQINLKLNLHPDKINLRKYSQGIDFLGYIVLPHYKALRTKTKRRIFKKIKARKEKLIEKIINDKKFNQSLQSYYGVLKHCNGYKIKMEVDKIINIFKL
jgi:RNA-directed DNA polymerase